jgi:hypothetical protein
MSQELEALERDIRATRSRLAANLSVLTSTQAIDQLKSAVKTEAIETTDDLMERAKTSGIDMLRRGLDELKHKAMQNPAAVAALGAGIGWKFWKNPPVATALLGYGLFSLLRGPDRDPVQNAVRDASERLEGAAVDAFDAAAETARGVRDRAASAFEDARQTATSLSDQARDKAASLLGDAKDTAAFAPDKAASPTAGSRQRATAIMTEARDTASSLASEGRETAQDMWARSKEAGQGLIDELSDRSRHIRTDPQSQLMLGIAGVAVAAAVGIAVNRYRAGHD